MYSWTEPRVRWTDRFSDFERAVCLFMLLLNDYAVSYGLFWLRRFFFYNCIVARRSKHGYTTRARRSLLHSDFRVFVHCKRTDTHIPMQAATGHVLQLVSDIRLLFLSCILCKNFLYAAGKRSGFNVKHIQTRYNYANKQIILLPTYITR